MRCGDQISKKNGFKNMTEKMIKKILTNRTKRNFFGLTNISIKNKYVYFAIAKNANSTIKHHLSSVEYEGTPYELKNVHKNTPMIKPYQLDTDTLYEALCTDLYNRFTIIRNPYTRLLSCWLDRIHDFNSTPYYDICNLLHIKPTDMVEISFSKFINAIKNQKYKKMNMHWRPQIFESNIQYIYIHKIYTFENIFSNLESLSQFLFGSIKPTFLNTNINKSPSITNAQKKISQHYTEDLIEIVYNIYKDDFAKFGYSQDINHLHSDLYFT